jgi:uncharacterized membrane protein YphA (DoxX/SURF4 family)
VKTKEIMDWLRTAARIFCGAVLLYASFDKLGESEKFLAVVKEYHVMPHTLEPLAAVVIPWLEALVGLALLVGFRWRGAALVYCALMAGYSLGLSINLVRGVEMNCGCFSMEAIDKVTWWTVLRDLVLFLPGLWALLGKESKASLEGLLRRIQP